MRYSDFRKVQKIAFLGVFLVSISNLFAENKVVILKDTDSGILNSRKIQDSYAFSFESYVSNPRPTRNDPLQGLVQTYDSPFEGLIKPSANETTLKPLPKPIGLLIESVSGAISFYDVTSNAVCSDVRGQNLIFRFVDPKNPQNAAVVSRVAFAVTGKAVPTGKIKLNLFDTAGNLLHTDAITSGNRLDGLQTDIECISYEDGKEKPLIHKLVIEYSGSDYFIIGTAQFIEKNDFAFAGFKTTDTPVVRQISEMSKIVHSQQWEKQNEAFLITDMSQAMPLSSLSNIQKKGKWKVLEYETFDFAGKALSINPDSEAPPVTLKINRKGWHAIYVGLGTVPQLGSVRPNQMKVKLSSEDTYARISNKLKLAAPRRDVIEEIYIKAVDITDEDIVINSITGLPALLCYIKLIPLTEEEVKQIQDERQRKDLKPVVATFDGHSWIWPYNPKNENDLKDMFYFFKDSDFNIWWFQVLGADLVHYKSNVGTIPGYKIDSFPIAGYKSFTDSVLGLAEKGINPLQVAVDAAHEQNVPILIMLRAQGWKGAPPLEDTFSSDFYEQHPEWRCVDYEGKPVMHMSYAVPEVQEHLMDVLAEALETNADGGGMFFHRGMPTLLWEEPFCLRFKQKFGIDPKTIAEDDPRIYELRSDIMTEFIQRMRNLLDQTQEKTGRKERMPLAVSTFSTKKDNEKFGLDVEKWIKMGLIDQIGIAWFAYHTSFKNPVDMEYYESITKDTNVQVFPFLVGWKMTNPENTVKMAAKYYEQGAEGIAVWDPFPDYGWTEEEGSSWPIVSKLGHEKELQSGEMLKFKTNKIKLKRLDQNYYSEWFPNTGF